MAEVLERDTETLSVCERESARERERERARVLERDKEALSN